MAKRHLGRPKRTEPWPACKADGCEKTSEGGSHGFCHTHYVYVRRGIIDKETGTRLREPMRISSYGEGARCSVEGCQNRPKAAGLCHGHWQRTRNGLPLTSLLDSTPRGRKPNMAVCCVEPCEKRATSKGMCQGHAEQRRRGILDEQGSKLREPMKGGRPRIKDRWIGQQGYVLVLCPFKFKSMARQDGTVLEHRLMMAQHLGRPLEDWEIVHHKNGVRDSNCVNNLELLDGRAESGREGHPPGHVVDKEFALQSLLQDKDVSNKVKASLRKLFKRQ
jgi:hypothetical protein